MKSYNPKGPKSIAKSVKEIRALFLLVWWYPRGLTGKGGIIYFEYHWRVVTYENGYIMLQNNIWFRVIAHYHFFDTTVGITSHKTVLLYWLYRNVLGFFVGRVGILRLSFVDSLLTLFFLVFKFIYCCFFLYLLSMLCPFRFDKGHPFFRQLLMNLTYPKFESSYFKKKYIPLNWIMTHILLINPLKRRISGGVQFQNFTFYGSDMPSLWNW